MSVAALKRFYNELALSIAVVFLHRNFRHFDFQVTFDTENFNGKIVDNPKRDDIDLSINEQLIVEWYSK